MKDASNRVLYVGKAKDLKQRLNHYRVANPDRMPRRHLRMVREVDRIELQLCSSEAAALKQESKLLRSLKPKFNRAGVWPGKARFIAWRFLEQRLELGVVETPEPDWRRFGPLNGSAVGLQRSLARLLWLALNPTRACTELPAGWAQNKLLGRVVIDCRKLTREIEAGLPGFFWQSADEFLMWLGRQFCERTHSFERAVIESEMKTLKEFSAGQKQAAGSDRQLALL
jgi:excinuclease UvrABC nuclease subunit